MTDTYLPLQDLQVIFRNYKFTCGCADLIDDYVVAIFIGARDRCGDLRQNSSLPSSLDIQEPRLTLVERFFSAAPPDKTNC